jgi:hypothetical protein
VFVSSIPDMYTDRGVRCKVETVRGISRYLDKVKHECNIRLFNRQVNVSTITIRTATNKHGDDYSVSRLTVVLHLHELGY